MGYPRIFVQLACFTCSQPFQLLRGQVNEKKRKQSPFFFCSRKCASLSNGFPLIRFYEHISKPIQINECWNWLGCLDNKGYGAFSVNGKRWQAHRYSYAIHIGPIPDGLWILHKNECHNPQCVNPKHLYAGTPKQNTADALALGTLPAPPHKHGHEASGAILQGEDVILIRSLYGKVTGRELAAQFRVHECTISAIQKRRIWKHLL